MLDAVTAISTSTAFDVSLRRKLSAEISLVTTTGTGTFGFSVSNDGTNFITYNRMTTNVTDDNTHNDTRVASITLSSGTPKAMVLFPEGDYFRYIKTIWTTVTGAIVTSAIGAGGTGYSVNDVLTVADGTSGTITVLTVNGSGVVLTYALTTGGSGYSIATHAVTGGTGNDDFTLSVLTVNAGLASVSLQSVD